MTTDEYRNPSRGPEDMYAVLLLKKGTTFRVFAPHTKNEAQRIKRNILRAWKTDSTPEEGFSLRIVQCWTNYLDQYL